MALSYFTPPVLICLNYCLCFLQKTKTALVNFDPKMDIYASAFEAKFIYGQSLLNIFLLHVLHHRLDLRHIHRLAAPHLLLHLSAHLGIAPHHFGQICKFNILRFFE